MTPPRPGSARCRALLLELSRYLEGDLAPERRRVIERHLKDCTTCERMETCLRRTIAACRAEGKVSLPRDVRLRAYRRITALRKR